MANPQKRKGDRAERAVALLINELTGLPARRKLGAGRRDDVGDIDGIPDTIVQVCNRPSNALSAVRGKPLEAELQRLNAGATHAATFVKLVGGEYRVVLTPEQWATYVRESL